MTEDAKEKGSGFKRRKGISPSALHTWLQLHHDLQPSRESRAARAHNLLSLGSSSCMSPWNSAYRLAMDQPSCMRPFTDTWPCSGRHLPPTVAHRALWCTEGV